MALDESTGVVGAAARIGAVVGAWPDVETGTHRFGGVEFRVGRRELGHLHGDGWADLPFPRRIRDELVASGRAMPHRALPDSGWITFPIRSEGDVDLAIELFRMTYERAGRSQARRPSGV
jgi:Family of unknown function (DUF5519)